VSCRTRAASGADSAGEIAYVMARRSSVDPAGLQHCLTPKSGTKTREPALPPADGPGDPRFTNGPLPAKHLGRSPEC